MKPKILIIGATGKLGLKLLNFCSKRKIKLDTITCHNNKKKLFEIKKKEKILNTFALADFNEKIKFIKFLKLNKFDIIYFLDYGSLSLEFLQPILKYNNNSFIAIANKELLIAGGKLLINKIKKSKNKLIPLDSEHFSLFDKNISNENVSKIYITASGGPFYFNKKIDLKEVNFKSVINHPKWKMGINNSIDSSNFVNKYLEMFELSIIYNIDLSKIDFFISSEAYVHSIIFYKDGNISFNCFDNNMIIPLIRPLQYFYDLGKIKISKKYLNNINFSICEFKDSRFKINLFKNKIRCFNHEQIIKFLLLNNIAHKDYINGRILYDKILNNIFSKIYIKDGYNNLDSFERIINYIKMIKKKYV